MLNFDDKGFLIPDNSIRTSLDDFEQIFVKNIPTQERKTHYQSYLNYSKKLKALCGNVELLQWIDGSFVTKKEKPNDIDLVTFLDFENTKDIHSELESFKEPLSKTVYQVDAYIVYTYSQNHKKYFFQQSDTAYWMDRFTKTKVNRKGQRFKKGFIEIIF